MAVYHERTQIEFKISSKREAQRIFGATTHENIKYICRFLKKFSLFMAEILKIDRATHSAPVV